jgi:hypothetical protein
MERRKKWGLVWSSQLQAESQKKSSALINGETNNLKSGSGQLAVVAVDNCTARAMRPYGIWTCADGRQILFNRDYVPILQRYPGQPCEPANPDEWVEFVEQRWFYKDGTPRELIKILVDIVLADWGLAPMPPPQPRALECRRLSRHERRKLPNPYVRVMVV